MKLSLDSSAFTPNAEVPARFTCEGEDISPPLAWFGGPQHAKSWALIVDDPDAPDPAAPKRTWVHWVLYNLAGECRELPENAARSGLPEPARHGANDWGKATYGGPCPPVGRHRYFFKLFALDTVLPDLHRPTKAQLLAAMQGHVLAEAVLIGTYQKQGLSRSSSPEYHEGRPAGRPSATGDNR